MCKGIDHNYGLKYGLVHIIRSTLLRPYSGHSAISGVTIIRCTTCEESSLGLLEVFSCTHTLDGDPPASWKPANRLRISKIQSNDLVRYINITNDLTNQRE
jgi:hypothetical protein